MGYPTAWRQLAREAREEASFLRGSRPAKKLPNGKPANDNVPTPANDNIVAETAADILIQGAAETAVATVAPRLVPVVGPVLLAVDVIDWLTQEETITTQVPDPAIYPAPDPIYWSFGYPWVPSYEFVDFTEIATPETVSDPILIGWSHVEPAPGSATGPSLGHAFDPGSDFAVGTERIATYPSSSERWYERQWHRPVEAPFAPPQWVGPTVDATETRTIQVPIYGEPGVSPASDPDPLGDPAKDRRREPSREVQPEGEPFIPPGHDPVVWSVTIEVGHGQGTGTDTRGNPEVTIIGRIAPGTAQGESVPREPPGKGTKERKAIGNIKGSSAIGIAINTITEGADFIYAIHDALPKHLKTGWYKIHLKGGGVTWVKRKVPTPWQAAKDIYDHAGDLDVKQALQNLVIEGAKDYIYGKAGTKLTKASQPWLNQIRRPFGLSTGPAI